MKNKYLRMVFAARAVVLTLLFGVAGMTRVLAQTFTEGNLNYLINDDAVSVTVMGHVNGSSATGSLTIPEIVTYEGTTFTVTAIGNGAFYFCQQLTGNLFLPNSLISIGKDAFMQCKGFTGGLIIPNSVTDIGNRAFMGCGNFTGDIVISNSLTTIGDYTFNGCGFTDELTIPNSVTTIGNHAFDGCKGLTGLTLPNSVTIIGDGAFAYCFGLTGDLNIPNSVTTIGNEAFYRCSGFTGCLTVGDSVTFIGERLFGAFGGSIPSFETIVVSSGNTTFDSRENCNAIIETSTNTLRYGCNNSIIPVSVTAIGDYAFFGCNGLTGELMLSNSVVAIGDWAFQGCGFTGNLTIPSSVTTIGEYAFMGCGFTGDLIIPNSVTTIGDKAFSYCRGFTGDLVISNSVISIGNSAFENSIGFTGNLIIGNSVTTIGEKAFYQCYQLTGDLSLPTSLEMIGDEAFFDCIGLSGRLVIPRSVAAIGNKAFVLTSFEEIIVESGNPYYDSREDCNSIIETSTNTLVHGCNSSFIPNTVTAIADRAFYRCSGLVGTLFISSAVTDIGQEAFAGCNGIEAIVVESGNPNYDSRENCNAIIEKSTNTLVFGCKNSFIPNSVIEIGSGAFYYCTDLKSVIIPNSVTNIKSSSFERCEGLTGNIIIPSSVTNIGTAFIGCVNLSGIIICSLTPPRLGEMCFYNTSIQIYVPFESLDLYLSAPVWNYEAAYIHPISKAIPGCNGGEIKWNFIASPTSGNTAPVDVENMIPNANDAFSLYRFNQGGQTEWEDYQGHNSNVNPFYLVNGQGYLYASQEDTYLVFKGAYNYGETEIIPLDYSIGANYQGWNLVGNPFMDNTYVDRCYYVMNSDGNNIVPVAVSSETLIGPMEGIMVRATDSGQSITFSKNPPEVTNNGIIKIEVSTNDTLNSLMDRVIISFNEDDRLEKFIFNDQIAQLYISKGNEDFAIVYSNQQAEQQLNFKAKENDSYSLRVYPINVEMNYLHLIDNISNVDIDLLMMPEYTFEGKTTDDASRFRLVFRAGNNIEENESIPFALFSNGQIIITDIEGTATLQVIDMLGRVIISESVTNNFVKQLNLTPGIYVVRLNEHTQKIVVP